MRGHHKIEAVATTVICKDQWQHAAKYSTIRNNQIRKKPRNFYDSQLTASCVTDFFFIFLLNILKFQKEEKI